MPADATPFDTRGVDLGHHGPELAICIGWLLNGTRGGLIAGTLFVLPGFVALAVFGVPFPVVIAAAAVVGWALGRLRPGIMAAPARKAAQDGPAPLISDEALHHTSPSWRRAALSLGLGVPLWLGPVAAAFVVVGALPGATSGDADENGSHQCIAMYLCFCCTGTAGSPERTETEETVMADHDKQAEHTVADHAHGEGCGHETVQHEGHVDYVHDGHKHALHEDHYDEH